MVAILPFSCGALTVLADGTVHIRRTGWASYTVFPFAQPQPMYIREAPGAGGSRAELTTDGTALLRAAIEIAGLSEYVIVGANHDLLCALLIAPRHGVTLQELRESMTLGHDGRLVMDFRRPWFGTFGASYLVFHPSYDLSVVSSTLIHEHKLPPREN